MMHCTYLTDERLKKDQDQRDDDTQERIYLHKDDPGHRYSDHKKNK